MTRSLWSGPAARGLKRALDVVVAGLLLAALSPVLALTWLVVRLTLGRPALYLQERPGYRERPFRLIKFRTMTDARTPDGRLRPDAERLVPLGRFLRSTSLDELPELINVVRGEMSLVGPRPLLMDYLPRYSREQRRRHEVPPGITGWAQIHGRNELSWEERFSLDVWYVEHWSLLLDLRILAATVRAVLSRRGITEAGHATMTPFQGSAVRVAHESVARPRV